MNMARIFGHFCTLGYRACFLVCPGCVRFRLPVHPETLALHLCYGDHLPRLGDIKYRLNALQEIDIAGQLVIPNGAASKLGHFLAALLGSTTNLRYFPMEREERAVWEEVKAVVGSVRTIHQTSA